MASQKEIRVECPACDERLAIDVRSARVVAHQSPRRTDSAGRPKLTEGDWDAAMSRVQDRSKRGDDLLDRALKREQGLENKLDSLFGSVQSRMSGAQSTEDLSREDDSVTASSDVLGFPRWGSAAWIERLDAVERRMMERRNELREALPGNPRAARTERHGDLLLLLSDRWNALLGVSSQNLDPLPAALERIERADGDRFANVLPEAEGAEREAFRVLAERGWSLDGFDALFARELGPDPIEASQGVRPARDATEFGELLMAGWGDDIVPDQIAANVERLAAEFSSAECRLFVVEVDGRAAGAASCWIDAAGVVDLSLAAVLPAFRGRGLQRQLIRARLEAGRAAGCHTAIGSPKVMTASESSHRSEGFELAFPIYVFRPPQPWGAGSGGAK